MHALLAATSSAPHSTVPIVPSAFTPLQDLVPEGILLLGALVCIALAALRRGTAIRTYQLLSGFALLAAAGANMAYLRGMPTSPVNPGYQAFGDGLVLDRFTLFLTGTLCAFGLITVLLGTVLSERIHTHAGEYHAFVLLATLGAVLLVSTREMISMYVAVELLGVSMVLLVGTLKTARRGGEAAIKQLAGGIASSAILLYGLAILYGVGGSTDLVEVAHNATHPSAALVLAMALVLVGLIGKLGAVPFQRLMPDVLQGAPGPVVGFAASAAITGVFGLFLRVAVTAFPAVQSNWQALVAVVAAASMLYGSLLALRQHSVRRLAGHLLLAYVGAALMGVLGWHQNQQGLAAVLFALATGGVAALAVGAVITAVENSGTADSIEEYRGLAHRAPGTAAALTVAVLSLAGLPPLVGFFARIFTMQAAVLAGYAWLMVVALAATVLGGVAAVRLLRALYAEGQEEAGEPVDAPRSARFALAVCGVAVVGLVGVVQPLMALASGGAGAVTVR